MKGKARDTVTIYYITVNVFKLLWITKMMKNQEKMADLQPFDSEAGICYWPELNAFYENLSTGLQQNEQFYF